MSESKPAAKRSSLGQRIITGAVLLALLVAVVAIGGITLALVAYACLMLCLYEELNALKLGGHHPVEWTSYAGLTLAVPLMMRYSTIALAPLLTLLGFCVALQVMRRREPDLVDILVSVMPLLTIVVPGMCLFGILDTQPREVQLMLFVFLFAAAIGCDTLAYCVGSLVGGPKLCPKISPNKTIAGAVGGLAGSVLCVTLAGVLFFPAPGGSPVPMWATVLLGLAAGVAAQVGDLFASMVKRHCKIKDFGHFLPGHGGMLDRLDSVVFTAIVIYCYRMILVGLKILA